MAQSNVGNKYGLNVVNKLKLFENEITVDSNKQMVDVLRKIPSVVLDLKYAGINNFMHAKLYPSLHTTYLRLPAANALKKVVADLESNGLTIKIFDAYRPYSITEQMWEKVKDGRYAADPAKGSGHNRGIAVDVTIVDLRTKKEITMPTGFDNFSDTAHQDFMQLPAEVVKNRLLLKSTMEKYGFVPLETEWWHFSLSNANNYELLNLSFDDLKKLSKRQR
ncbi:MAG: M15 family metallopeptidase [Bacteroidota bacterium]|nr:M15 family metallopeptidase [Bacteroidota bacterium]